jgi:hypothetical protein
MTTTPRRPPPRTRARTVRPALIVGRGDTLVGSWPARCHRTGRCFPPRRRPVHPGRGGCRHRRRPVRIRPGLGDVGRALGPVHRSAAAMDRGSCPVHGPGRPAPGGVWLPGAPGARLGVAPGHAGLGRLDARPRPSTASEPEQALAALPGDRDVGAGLVGWRLPDPGCSRRCQGLPDAWAVDRRGRTPPAPELHRLGHAHRGAGTGRRRDVVESRVDRAGRRPGHPGLRLRPRRSRVERAR